MEELGNAALAYYPLVFAPLILLLLAPVVGSSMRRAFAAVLAVGAIGLSVLASVQSSTDVELGVVNPFPRDDGHPPDIFITEHVGAPGWQWPLVGALFLAVPGLLLYLRRNLPPRSPSPLLTGSALGLWFMVGRLALEKTAAPLGLTWALGLSPAVAVMLPFLGAYAGARGRTFWQFVLMLLCMALIQRLVLSGVGYFATLDRLGTHLDVGVIDEVHPPFGGAIVFQEGDLTDRWLRLIAIPQLMFWVPATVVAGVALGGIPYWVARKHAQR